MAHPLNRPRFDAAHAARRRGLRACCSRASRRRCRSAARDRSSSASSPSPSGIDPYAAAVSDVYQDLFGEGSYTGKGIYDVDAFEAALDGRVPENTLLSHDLFEGIFARAGLASDIEVVEEFPSRYDVAAARQHRWARGDWQLLPWIFGRGDAAATRQRERAAADRPLEDAGQSAALAVGAGERSPRWWPAGRCRCTAALVWTGFVLATIALPALLPVARRDRAATRPGSRRAATCARSAATCGSRSSQIALLGHVPRPSGVADGRRDRDARCVGCS